MIEAIIDGEDNPERLADLARRRLRQRIPDLQVALSGRARDHHRFLLKEHMSEWKALSERIIRVEQEIDRRIVPFEHAVTRWKTIPGIDHVTAWLSGCGTRSEHGSVSFSSIIGFLGWSLSGPQ
jgi:transposase